MPLARAWDLVSANPAKAAGLKNKGRLPRAKMQTLSLQSTSMAAPLSIRGVISQGKIALWRGALLG